MLIVMRVRTTGYTHIYIYTIIYIYIFMYMYIYIYMHICRHMWAAMYDFHGQA